MGKKLAIFIPLMIVVGILQTSLFSKMMILNAMPNLVFVTVCTIAYFFGSEDGLLFGVVGGLTLDILTEYMLGTNALLFAITGFIIGFFPRKNFWDKLPIAFGIVMAAVFSEQMVAYFLERIGLYLSGAVPEFSLHLGGVLFQRVLPGLLYDAIIFLPIYFICRGVDRHMDKGKKFMADF